MLLVLLVGLVLMREANESPLLDYDENFIGWLSANSAHADTLATLVLVEINNSSMGSQHPWPWSPLDFALFLDDALKFHPEAIGIEPVPEWDPEKLNADAQLKYPQFEKILHERILLAPKIVLGAELGFPEDPDVVPPPQPVPVLRKLSGSARDVPSFTAIEREPKEELRLSSTLGFTNVPVVREPLRHAPLVFSYDGQIVPSFVLQTLMLWFKLTVDDVKVDFGNKIALGDKVTIPIDSSGSMLVDFRAPFTRVGFEDLLLATEQIEAKLPPVIQPEVLAGKLVILARTDDASRIYHFPIGRRGSSGELAAAAIATVQSNAFIRRIGFWFDGVIVAAMMLLSWFLYRRPRQSAIPIAALSMVIYLTIGLVIFASYHLALPLSLPLGLAIFVALFRLVAPGESLPQTAD